MDNDAVKNAYADRKKFMDQVSAKAPVTAIIEKGKFAGKKISIISVQKGPNALEYWGIVGGKKVAIMGTNSPIGGFTQVTSSQVAQDYWRSGIAHRIYSEILSDLADVNATLEPHWNSMTPDAARFWKSLKTDDIALQSKLDAIISEQELSGATKTHDDLKSDENAGGTFWNGEKISKKKLADLGIDTSVAPR